MFLKRARQLGTGRSGRSSATDHLLIVVGNVRSRKDKELEQRDVCSSYFKFFWAP
jgi:hypothetical protein